MKSNIAKYLLVAFGVIGAIAPITNTSAYNMRDLLSNYSNCSPSYYPRTNVFNVDSSLLSQYYNKDSGYLGSSNDNYLNLDFSSKLKDSQFSWYHTKRTTSSSYSCHYVSYPLIGFEDNGQGGIIFKYFVDGETPYMANFSVGSRAGFNHTFNDGYSCVMSEVYFNVGSIIFKCSDSNRTYQILAGGYTLGNHFLYVDLYNSSNNVWRIGWEEGQARSITVSQAVRSQIAMGGLEINQSFLENLFHSGYTSYSISTGGNNIFPTCGLASCTTQSDDDSPGYVYSRDLVQVAPDFGGSNTTNPDDGNNIVPIGGTAYSGYLSCFQDWTEISSFANSWNDCRSQAMSSGITLNEFMNVEDYVLNFTGDDNENWRDITDNVSCQAFMLSAKIEYDQYGSGYYSHLISVAKNYKNASNSLPVEAYCGSNPLTNETKTITTWEDIYSEALQANTPLSGEDCSNRFTCTLQEWIDAPKQYIYDNLIGTYSGAFHSGYNAVDFVSCPTQSYWETNYGNYIFIAGVVFLVFIFISII